MTCQTCAYRLDVTLWGLWLLTVCRSGLVISGRCANHQPQECGTQSASSGRHSVTAPPLDR